MTNERFGVFATTTSDDDRRGFHIKFENGFTVSIQWGRGIYNGPTTAEVGAWDNKGVWLRLGDGDDVLGYQSPEKVAELLSHVAALPSDAVKIGFAWDSDQQLFV